MSMRLLDIRPLVDDVPVTDLIALTDPRLVRYEPENDRVRGISSVVEHSIRAGLRAGALRWNGSQVTIPTSLLTPDRQRICVEARHNRAVESSGRYGVTGLVTEDPPLWERVGSGRVLPWEKGAGPALPTRLVTPLWTHHFLDHPERFPGLDRSQIEKRLRSALERLRWAVRRGVQRDLAAYWYEGGSPGWHHVAPLTIHGSQPLAAVLSPVAGRPTCAKVTTVLPRHEAFWNVVTSGRRPPRWLDAERPRTHLPVAG